MVCSAVSIVVLTSTDSSTSSERFGGGLECSDTRSYYTTRVTTSASHPTSHGDSSRFFSWIRAGGGIRGLFCAPRSIYIWIHNSSSSSTAAVILLLFMWFVLLATNNFSAALAQHVFYKKHTLYGADSAGESSAFFGEHAGPERVMVSRPKFNSC